MGIFSNLFHKGKLLKSVDLSVLKTDMHSHLIPGIDDGSDTLETSMELIKGMMGLGFKKIITTPHIQGEFYQNTPKIIMDGLEKVKREMKKQFIHVEIEAAAEYLIDDKFEEKYKDAKLLTFGENYLLVEFSYFNEHPNWKKYFFDLQVEGYKVILAHPERYSYFFRIPQKYEELKDRGVLFQLNLLSLAGYYSADVKKVAEKLIDLGMIDLVGTDMHNNVYMQWAQTARSEVYLKKIVDSGKLMNSSL